LSAGKVNPIGVCFSCLLDVCIRNAKQYLGLAVIGAARQKQSQTDNNNICQNGVSSAFSHRAYLTQHAALTCLPITSRLKTSRQSPVLLPRRFRIFDPDPGFRRALINQISDKNARRYQNQNQR
jgi:hypothetical protein